MAGGESRADWRGCGAVCCVLSQGAFCVTRVRFGRAFVPRVFAGVAPAVHAGGGRGRGGGGRPRVAPAGGVRAGRHGRDARCDHPGVPARRVRRIVGGGAVRRQRVLRAAPDAGAGAPGRRGGGGGPQVPRLGAALGRGVRAAPVAGSADAGVPGRADADRARDRARQRHPLALRRAALDGAGREPRPPRGHRVAGAAPAERRAAHARLEPAGAGGVGHDPADAGGRRAPWRRRTRRTWASRARGTRRRRGWRR